MKAQVKLVTIIDIKEFVSEMQKFESDVNVIKGHYVIDGKSLLGMFSIDATKGVDVEILSNNSDEIEHFLKTTERWG